MILIQNVIGDQEASAREVGLRQRRSGGAGADLDGLPARLLKSPFQVVEKLRRVLLRIVAQEQNVDLFGFRLNKINRVVEIIVVAGQHQPFARRSLRQLRRGDNPALARRNINLERPRAGQAFPAELKLFTLCIGGVADPDPRTGIGVRLCRIVRVHHPLQARVGGASGLDPFNGGLDATWPFVSLQSVEPAALLQVRDENNLPRANVLALFVSIGKSLGGGDEGIAQMGDHPARLQLTQPLRGQGHALAGVHGRPFLKADERTRLRIESEYRDPVRRQSLLQNFLRLGDRRRPQSLATHAGAAVHEQDDFSPRARLRVGHHRFLKERTREAQGQQAKHQTAQDEQKNILQSIAPRYPGRGRLEKHERAERQLFLARAADEMENNRQRDGQSAQQK